MCLRYMTFAIKTALLILSGCLSYSFAQTIIQHKTIEELRLLEKKDISSSFEKIPYNSEQKTDSLRIKYNLKNVSLGGVPTKILIPQGLNKAFILVSDEHKLYIVDLPTGEILQILSFKEIPRDLKINHQNTQIYVLTWAENKLDYPPYETGIAPGFIYAIDVMTNSVNKKIFPGANDEVPFVVVSIYRSFFLSPDDNYLYICGFDNWVYIYDLHLDKLINVISTANPTVYYSSAISTDGGSICLMSKEKGRDFTIPVIIDLKNNVINNINTVGFTLSFGSFLPSIVPGPGNTFFIETYDSTIQKRGTVVVDGKLCEVIKFIEEVTPQAGIHFNEDSTLIYLHHLKKRYAILDMQNFETRGYVPTVGFSGIMSPDCRRFFIANYSPVEEAYATFGDPINLNITAYNVNFNYSYEISTNNPGNISHLYFRPITISSDGNYILAGNSEYNNISIISGLTEIIPEAPSTESAELDSSNPNLAMLLKWNKPESSYSYYLQVSDSSGFNNMVFEDSMLSNINYAVGSLLPDTDYFWRVKSKNLVGWSEWSDTASFRTIDVPQKPVLVNPLVSDSLVQVNPVLKWNKTEGSLLYKLQVSDDPLFTRFFINDSTITDTARQVNSLLNNTTYYWRVFAKNHAGWSEPSDIWSFKTIVSIPGRVTLIYPENNAPLMQDSIEFKWSPAGSYANKYWFELSEDTLSAATVIDSSLTDTIKSITGFNSNKNYWWRVKAFNAAGWSDFSDYYSFIISYCDVNEGIKPADYCLSQNYPNPFNPSTNISFSLKEPGQVSIIVYNMLGEKISELINEYRSAGSYDIVFRANDIPSGIYFYTIRSGNFVQTRKMLLLR